MNNKFIEVNSEKTKKQVNINHILIIMEESSKKARIVMTELESPIYTEETYEKVKEMINQLQM